MIRLSPAPLLAFTATGTAVCMSILAGWQRGGWVTERVVWIATGVVLVAGAHLLPVLCRSTPLAARSIGTVLWLGCMATASYGHATFFLLSQSHAGTLREQLVAAGSPQAQRSLTAVMAERATVTANLAAIGARHCVHDCPSLQARRMSLNARLDALNAESGDIRRLQINDDRDAARRDAARDDPVTARLAALWGTSTAKLDLFAGLAFAAVLEGVACLLWWVAWTPHVSRTPVATDSAAETQVAPDPKTAPSAIAAPVTELDLLLRDVSAGLLRPTVSGIRQHLRCSQTKAIALRRQLAESAA